MALLLKATSALVLAVASVLSADAPNPALSSYAYISPAAKAVLQKLNVTEAELIRFVDSGLKSRTIFSIDPNRVYEGSDDSMRIDIRKLPKGLLVELSVRQGVSVHNMLQRWVSRDLVCITPDTPTEKSKQLLLDRISVLLDQLKIHFNSPKYRKGEMLEQ